MIVIHLNVNRNFYSVLKHVMGFLKQIEPIKSLNNKTETATNRLLKRKLFIKISSILFANETFEKRIFDISTNQL